MSLVLLVYLLLWIPFVQQKIVDIALHEITKKTGNRMTIGDIRLRPFNSLHLHDVYAADLQGDTLLYVERLSAGFRLWPLLRSRLVIHSAELDHFAVNLKRDSVGAPFNFQFFIDAFASADTDTTKGNFTVKIDHIRLTRGRFSYEILSAARKDSVFDANHIRVTGLEANIRLPSIDMKQLDVAVQDLSFREQSGFVLENLAFGLKSTNELMTLSNLEIQLPHSLLKIPGATVDYTGMPLSHLADSAKYALMLDVPEFHFADMKAFVPSLNGFAESITLRSSISGRFPAVGIDSLSLSYGSGIRLQLAALLDDYKHWDTAPFELHIPELIVKPQSMMQMAALSGDSLPVHTERIHLEANIAGALPALKLNIAATSAPSGKLDITGTGGYWLRTGETHFDLSLAATDFDLKTFLNSNPNLGLVSFALDAAGSIDSTGYIDANAGLEVVRFDFRQYSYRDITVAASYVGKHAALQLTSRDQYAPLLIRAEADLGNTPLASLYLKTANLMPDKLNLTPEYKDADLFAVLKTEVEGFDPDQMTAVVSLDSVRFTTTKGTAELPAIRLGYEALPGFKKRFDLQSVLMDVAMEGRFSVHTIVPSLRHTLALYFPNFVEAGKPMRHTSDSLGIRINMRNAENWADLLDLPIAIIDTASLTAVYYGRSDHIGMEGRFPETKLNDMILRGSRLSLQADTINRVLHFEAGTIRLGAADTMHLGLTMKTYTDSLRLGTKFDIYTPKIKTGGELGLVANYTKVKGQKLPDIVVNLFPSMLRFNNQDVHVRQARLAMKNKEYEVDHFEVTLSDKEFLKVDGRVSRHEQDTLRVNLGGVQIGTLMQAVGAGVNLAGEINGNVVASRLLESPRILTDKFSISDITFENQPIGTLDLTSGWSKQLSAVLLKAELSRSGAQTSVISGRIFPQRDSLALNANISDMQLAWISPFTNGMLYNVKGALGARVRVEGKIKSPALTGTVSLKNANVGVSMLNVQYIISDSIRVYPDRLVMKDFRITDEKNQQAVINGEVSHTGFASFRPNLSMKLQDFLLLNNPNQTDSLFYGTLRMSGLVDASGSDKDMLVKVALKNSSDSKVTVNLPEDQASKARIHQSVTFVNKDTVVHLSNVARGQALAPPPKMPVRMELALEVTPEFQLGAVYNPKTKDAATVKGTGRIDFTYNMADSKMNLLGEYKISEGKATVSLKNITKREFTILQGGVVRFKGDPTATEFDVTAVYKLRADITTLDPTVFAVGEDVSRKRVNTECRIRVSGSMEKMTIGYAILFPDESESVQRKADALMSTDEIKVKEIAYLLVGGTFYPVSSTEPQKPSGNNIWTSLASSAATSLLNSMLEGVLNDNWTIGTELHSDDGSASNVEVDVNVSTNLFNDRLTVTSNIGYKNSATDNTSNTNFTGDFDVQYKLNKTGNIVLKMYNVTNDQIYDQAQSPTTQGVGILYRREEKRFKDLFKRVKKEPKTPTPSKEESDLSTDGKE